MAAGRAAPGGGEPAPAPAPPPIVLPAGQRTASAAEGERVWGPGELGRVVAEGRGSGFLFTAEDLAADGAADGADDWMDSHFAAKIEEEAASDDLKQDLPEPAQVFLAPEPVPTAYDEMSEMDANALWEKVADGGADLLVLDVRTDAE